MAPYQFIEHPSPFNTKGGKTLPVFAVTPAHIETGMVDPVALEWARNEGHADPSGAGAADPLHALAGSRQALHGNRP